MSSSRSPALSRELKRLLTDICTGSLVAGDILVEHGHAVDICSTGGSYRHSFQSASSTEAATSRGEYLSGDVLAESIASKFAERVSSAGISCTPCLLDAERFPGRSENAVFLDVSIGSPLPLAVVVGLAWGTAPLPQDTLSQSLDCFLHSRTVGSLHHLQRGETGDDFWERASPGGSSRESSAGLRLLLSSSKHAMQEVSEESLPMRACAAVFLRNSDTEHGKFLAIFRTVVFDENSNASISTDGEDVGPSGEARGLRQHATEVSAGESEASHSIQCRMCDGEAFHSIQWKMIRDSGQVCDAGGSWAEAVTSVLSSCARDRVLGRLLPIAVVMEQDKPACSCIRLNQISDPAMDETSRFHDLTIADDTNFSVDEQSVTSPGSSLYVDDFMAEDALAELSANSDSDTNESSSPISNLNDTSASSNFIESSTHNVSQLNQFSVNTFVPNRHVEAFASNPSHALFTSGTGPSLKCVSMESEGFQSVFSERVLKNSGLDELDDAEEGLLDALMRIRREKKRRRTLAKKQELEANSKSGQPSIDSKCIVCCSSPKDTLLLPCRHLTLCKQCSSQVTKCPVCRAEITQTVHVYN